MARQSQRFAGQWSSLKDNVSMQLMAMTGGVFEFAKDGLKHANMFFDRFGVGIERGMSPFQAGMRALKFSLQDALGKDAGNAVFGVINGISTGLQKVTGWAKQFATSVAVGRHLDALKKIGGSVLDIGRAFQRGGFVEGFKSIFGRDGQQLLRGFGDLFGARFKLIGDGLAKITTGFKPLDRVIGQTGRAFTDMGRLIQEVFQGDFGGAMEVGERLLRRFGTIGQAAFDTIREGIGAINWSSVAAGIGDFASGAWGAIQTGVSLAWDAITDLDWDDWIDPVDWATWIGGKIEDVATWAWDKIKEYFPQAAVFGGEAIADVASWAWDKIKQYFPQAAVFGGEAIADVGAWLWEKIKGFFPSSSVIGSTIAVLGDWLWGKIKSFFPSSSVITGAIADTAEWLWGKIETHFPAGAVIAGTIADVATWIWEKIGPHFPSAAVVAGSITDVGEWVWGKISGFFPSGAVISGSIADLGSWLYEKIGAPSVSIPDFPGWSAFWDYINPFGGGSGDGAVSGGADTSGGNVGSYAGPRAGSSGAGSRGGTLDLLGVGRAAPNQASRQIKIPAPDTSAFDAAMAAITGTPFTATLDLDIGPAAVQYTNASTFAEAWAARTFMATLDADNGPAAIKYTDAFSWGETWAAQAFTSTFDADNGPAAVAYTNAYGWGETWAGTTFSARFSVDLGPLENALVRTRQIVAEMSDLLPHSPAKRGPLARPISFGYIGDALLDTMRGMVRDTEAGMAGVSGALRGRRSAAFAGPSGRREAPIINVYAVKSDELVDLINGAKIGLRLGRNLSTQLQLLSQGAS